MKDYPCVDRFESATMVLPVMNETTSLGGTVRIIPRDVKDRIKEILMVAWGRTTPESMAAVDRMSRNLGSLVRVHSRELPFPGGAMREAFDLASGSHVVMMASDLETDPNAVKTLIANAEISPSAIVTATRWRAGGRLRRAA